MQRDGGRFRNLCFKAHFVQIDFVFSSSTMSLMVTKSEESGLCTDLMYVVRIVNFLPEILCLCHVH